MYIYKIVFYYTGETKERKRFIFLNIVKKSFEYKTINDYVYCLRD